MKLPRGSYRKLKLNTRLISVLCLLSVVQAILIGGFAWLNLARSLDQEIGHRALNVAKTVALTPSVILGIGQRDMTGLNRFAKNLAATNEALFIVIGDHNGIRLAHPNSAKLGKSMADDDGDEGTPALIQGLGYIDKAKGSLGYSMRGKAPVYDLSGEKIIGIVSVGYSLDQVDATIARYSVWLAGVLLLAMGGSVFFAITIARRLKREILGLEPEQIARLFTERDATLQSVREGIIAINRAGQITTFNRKAIETLGLSPDAILEGEPIDIILPDSGLMAMLETGAPQFDLEVWLRGKQMIVNRLPVMQGEEIIGAVSSFRPRNEVDLISQQLTKIEQYAEILRSQAHEYSNKLHTISGLIQLDAKQEALALIGRETSDHQDLLALLLNATPDPVIAGCLLGMFNRAKELGLNLVIDPESHLTDLPLTLTQDQLASILGNLIENAFEATRQITGIGGRVYVSLTDMGNDVIVEVQDEGEGIPESLQSKIFTKGFSSKGGGDHGYGLYLIQTIMHQCGGTIHVENVTPNGTRFILYIPKNNKKG
jgi:two-component system CitB family sensor kinase